MRTRHAFMNRTLVAAVIFALGSGVLFAPTLTTLELLAKQGAPVPGYAASNFATFGQSSINGDGEVMFDSAMSGAGTAGGKTRAIFSTLDTAPVVVNVLRLQDSLSSFGGSYVGTRVTSLSGLLLNHPTVGFFQAGLAGAGVTLKNNRVLLWDSGMIVTPILRTGEALVMMGGLKVKKLLEVIESRDAELLAVSHLLHPDAVLSVTGASDSGLIVLDFMGGIHLVSGMAREGKPAFGSSTGTFGQFFGRSAMGSASRLHFPAYYFFGDNTYGGKSVQALFVGDATGAYQECTAVQGAEAKGVWGALLRSFLGEVGVGSSVMFRASMEGMGVSTATNEGIWYAYPGKSQTLRVRKGVMLAPGFKITRFISFWPTSAGQMIVHAQIAGAGLPTGTTAVLLLQMNGTWMTLMRTGGSAPGISTTLMSPVRNGVSNVFIAAIQKVDVEATSGRYVILGSLTGVPSSANQALWTGDSSVGLDDEPGRRPVLHLRKGDAYVTTATPAGVIRGLELKPAVNPTGAGGRGEPHVISSNGSVVVGITGNNSVKELVVLK